jgi:NADH:ubiquinone oxidoreductase subunit F (NADH-binding)
VGTSRGTKTVSLNSLFRQPGLYEVELGVPVREIVERLGGGVDGTLGGVLIGGPLAGVLPADRLDTLLTFDDLRAVGCDVGHGGIVAFDEHTSLLELAHHVMRFAAYESCAKCSPCRLGTAHLEHLLSRALDGRADARAADEWHDTVAALTAMSLCGHGHGAGRFAESLGRFGRREVDRWFT